MKAEKMQKINRMYVCKISNDGFLLYKNDLCHYSTLIKVNCM